MSALPRSIVCDRVRGQISLRLDDELSVLEARMVDAHVARCADCREFEADIADVTSRMRAAPLERLTAPVVVQRAARTWVARAQVGMAAALAVVFFGAASQLAQRPSDSNVRHPDRYPTSTELMREVDQIVEDGRAFSHTSGRATPL